MIRRNTVWLICSIVVLAIIAGQTLPGKAGLLEPRLYFPIVSQQLYPIPSDPALRDDLQWYLVSKQNPHADLNAPAAWAVETGKPEVVLAIISSGLDIGNKEFGGRIVGWKCYPDVLGCTDVIDDIGWGTYLTSLAAAEGDNGYGMAGVAWDVGILPIKVTYSIHGPVNEADVVAGIAYACAEPNVRVVLVDGGFGGLTGPMQTAVANCTQVGVLVVAPVGDCGGEDYLEHGCMSRNESHYPAALSEYWAVLGVGVSTPTGEVAPFSTIGIYEEVDLVAPGVDIFGLRKGEDLSNLPNGTSPAAALAAGVAALIFSAHPDYSPQQVVDAMHCGSIDIGDLGKDHASGYGRLDAGKALSAECQP